MGLRNIKNFVLVLILNVTLIGCELSSTDIKSLKRPVVLIGKSLYGDIIVMGADGVIVSKNRDFYISRTISNTFNAGDTIFKKLSHE